MPATLVISQPRSGFDDLSTIMTRHLQRFRCARQAIRYACGEVGNMFSNHGQMAAVNCADCERARDVPPDRPGIEGKLGIPRSGPNEGDRSIIGTQLIAL